MAMGQNILDHLFAYIYKFENLPEFSVFFVFYEI
jgi:hypothetical protein